jgi:hypothetical protein
MSHLAGGTGGVTLATLLASVGSGRSALRPSAKQDANIRPFQENNDVLDRSQDYVLAWSRGHIIARCGIGS